jgi:hypothetical protein
VFLEGPQGGIWFWSIFGFGIVAADKQRRLFATAPRLQARATVGLARLGTVAMKALLVHNHHYQQSGGEDPFFAPRAGCS